MQSLGNIGEKIRSMQMNVWISVDTINTALMVEIDIAQNQRNDPRRRACKCGKGKNCFCFVRQRLYRMRVPASKYLNILFTRKRRISCFSFSPPFRKSCVKRSDSGRARFDSLAQKKFSSHALSTLFALFPPWQIDMSWNGSSSVYAKRREREMKLTSLWKMSRERDKRRFDWLFSEWWTPQQNLLK